MKTTVVLGIGNLLLMDEGVGVQAITALGERYSFPQGLELIDGGTMGLDLLPFIENKDQMLIIDAVDFSEPPGTIKIIEGDNIKKFLDTKFSVHQIGLPDMLCSAALMGILPKKFCLVGIQPHTVDTGLELSKTIAARMDDLLETVIERLRQWNIKIEEKDNVPCDSI